MNIHECQAFFKKQNADKNVAFELDDTCALTFELTFFDGLPNLVHNITYNKIKVTVEGQEPFMVPISPHKEVVGWARIKEILSRKTDVFIHEQTIQFMNAIEDKTSEKYTKAVEEIQTASGLSLDEVKQRLEKK